MTYGKIIEFMVTFSATIGITLCISKLFTRFFLRCMDPFESYFGIFSLIGLYYLVYAIQRTLWNYFILKSKKH